MLHASRLKGRRVWDAWGLAVGECIDTLVGAFHQPYPCLRSLALRNGDSGPHLISSDQTNSLSPSIMLKIPQSKMSAHEPHGDELRLLDQVLDVQIVGTEGRRMFRANDLQILPRESRSVSPVWMSAGCGCGSGAGHGRLLDIALPGIIVS